MLVTSRGKGLKMTKDNVCLYPDCYLGIFLDIITSIIFEPKKASFPVIFTSKRFKMLSLLQDMPLLPGRTLLIWKKLLVQSP